MGFRVEAGPPASASPPYVAGLAAGALFAERYQVARLLGSGGMGTVYEARDKVLGRRVALKVPHAHHLVNPAHRTRFHREAQAAARMWHPNICPIFDVGEVGTTLYLTMAFLEGKPLGALVGDGEPLGTALAVRLVRTLASALETAHDAGVLHLDLKPANVMVGAYHNPILMDFGLSRLVAEGDESLTLDAGLLGTPAYMAPEQIAGSPETVSAATDIYGLGVVFYELLTGRPPFRGSLLSVMTQAQADPPPSPRTLSPTLDERVAEVCLKMLAKAPADRPRSMTEVIELLEIIDGSEQAVVDRGPVRPPPSDRERLHDALSRRHAWEAVYYAKRLLQVNQHDAAAYNALSQLAANPRDLVYLDESRKQRVLNAFTRSMDTRTLVDFVVESGLVERDDGDIICRYNDPSDNMFLILRGEVGVFKPRPDATDAGGSQRNGPDFKSGAGHIVGELAFALKRSRTATMRALGRASLLAFSVSRLKQLAERGVMGTALSTSIDSYLKGRVLKYLFDNAKYLCCNGGEIVDRWQLVNHHAEVLTLNHQHQVLQADTCSRFTDRRGLVILASGQLRDHHVEGKRLHEDDLPILFAHFDNRLVYTYPRYEIDRPVTLVHIHQAAFEDLDHVAEDYFHEVIGATLKACAAQVHYDVFLSYTNRDRELATRWKLGLEAAGLRVYMDVQGPPKRFVPVIEAAILDSLVFMPLLTENTAARAGRDSWVQREIGFRSNVFGERACIVPVNFGGGRVARFAPGDLPIEAMGREPEAIEQTVALVHRLRAGEVPPPYSLRVDMPAL
jgi:serine/threonine protein kinase